MNNLLVWKLVSDYCEWFTIFELIKVCTNLCRLFNEEFWKSRFQSEYNEKIKDVRDSEQLSWKKRYLHTTVEVYHYRIINLYSFNKEIIPTDVCKINLGELVNLYENYRNYLRKQISLIVTDPITQPLKNAVLPKIQETPSSQKEKELMNILHLPFSDLIIYGFTNYPLVQRLYGQERSLMLEAFASIINNLGN